MFTPGIKRLVFFGAAICSPFLHAAILITAEPVPDPFPVRPQGTEWNTLQVGASTANLTPEAFDTKVIAATDAGVNFIRIGDAGGTIPPSISVIARWNSGGGNWVTFLQTKPTGEDYLLMLASLQNATGGLLSVVKITYEFSSFGDVAAEQTQGLRAFWSITGSPGSWTLIPGLSVATAAAIDAPDRLSATISLPAPLADGGRMYLLWADQNGPGTDASFHIRNFSASAETGGGDADGDGVSDDDESIMGTNPGNPADALRLSLHPGDPGQVDFPSKSGRFYRVYSSDNLQQWTATALPAIAGDGLNRQFNISTVAPAQRFYRLHVMLSDGPWPASIP